MSRCANGYGCLAEYFAKWQQKYKGARTLDEIIAIDYRLKKMNCAVRKQATRTVVDAAAFHEAVDRIKEEMVNARRAKRVAERMDRTALRSAWM